MTEQDKQLLLKDLCTRVPYGVICHYNCVEACDTMVIQKANCDGVLQGIVPLSDNNIGFMVGRDKVNALQGDIKPYLRPMSSMTEEEEREVRILWNEDFVGDNNWYHCYPKTTDFYLSHHLDFRNLIQKGLAIEAPKDMYKIE